MKRKNVLYVRLSVSDSDRGESCHSDSIDNQINFIKQYCNRKNITIEDYYIDDGYSGGNFERPQFRKLLCDIEKNLIGLVLVKDISRLGRNFVDVSYYVNQYFPSHGVSLISINDNYDSSNLESNYVDSVLNIRTFVNEKYLKDVSKKIKQVKLQKTVEKNYLGVVAPYGYVRIVKKGRNTLDVDLNTSNVVKQIFLDIAFGKKLSYVADCLNKNNIMSPGVYMGCAKEASKWTRTIVYRIVRNVIYCGNMFYRKSEKNDYKKKKRDYICLCDRKIISNTHPAIISKELFELANKKIRFNKKKVKCSYDSMFIEKLYCGVCGQKYILSRKVKKNGKEQYFFYCSNHKNCCNRTVSEQKLRGIVLNVFNNVLLGKVDVELVVSAIVESMCSKMRIQNKVANIKKCVNQYSLVLQDLYLKLASGRIDTIEFQKEKVRLSNQKRNCIRELELLQSEDLKSICEEKVRRKFNKFICDSNFCQKYFDYFVDKVVFYKTGRVEISFLFKNRQQMEIGTI